MIIVSTKMISSCLPQFHFHVLDQIFGRLIEIWLLKFTSESVALFETVSSTGKNLKQKNFPKLHFICDIFWGAFKAIWWAFFGGKFQYTAVSYFRPCSLSSSSSISLFSFKKRREQKAERPRKALLDLCCLFGMFFWAFFNQDWQVFYTLGKLDLTISKK